MSDQQKNVQANSDPKQMAEGWKCGHCTAVFSTLIAAIAHVEVKHPAKERRIS